MSERLIKTPIRYYFDNIIEMVKRREYGSMDKKEKSIKLHLDKAIGYSGKALDELQIALNIDLYREVI